MHCRKFPVKGFENFLKISQEFVFLVETNEISTHVLLKFLKTMLK